MYQYLQPRVLVFALLLIPFPVYPGEWSGRTGFEYRIFPEDAFDSQQNYTTSASLMLEPEYYHEWDNGRQAFAFVPFLRIDQQDPERTHFDIRELTWLKATENWELRVGIRKVFWGVIEFNHLIDIINQTDLVENIDTEDKLGQPMINLAMIRNWGTVDVFLMPWFREREFPGKDGRLRTQPPVDENLAAYESGAEEKHLDAAIRYSHYFGDWDIGISHFYGTSRDPRFFPALINGNLVLAPFYDIINQTSIDLQATKGSMLWKLEALHRSGQGKTFNAIAAGGEYTFFGTMDSDVDVGLLLEYHYDDRGEFSPNIFNDDIALGTRVALNDVSSTTALMGLLIDTNNGGKFLSIEASRRLNANWFLEIDGRFLFDQSRKDPAYSLTNDDYIEFFLTYNF